MHCMTIVTKYAFLQQQQQKTEEEKTDKNRKV